MTGVGGGAAHRTDQHQLEVKQVLRHAAVVAGQNRMDRPVRDEHLHPPAPRAGWVSTLLLRWLLTQCEPPGSRTTRLLFLMTVTVGKSGTCGQRAGLKRWHVLVDGSDRVAASLQCRASPRGACRRRWSPG